MSTSVLCGLIVTALIALIAILRTLWYRSDPRWHAGHAAGRKHRERTKHYQAPSCYASKYFAAGHKAGFEAEDHRIRAHGYTQSALTARQEWERESGDYSSPA